MCLRRFLGLRVCSFLIGCALLSSPAFSQQDGSSDNSPSQAQNDSTTEGTVVASSHITFVVKSDDGQFHLYTFDRNTNRPRTLAVGTRVLSDQGDKPGARHATEVILLDQAQGPGSEGGGTPNVSARKAAPLPQSVQNAEGQIQHEARRWRLGARAGIGLDPELVMFGVDSQVGPIFSRNVFFRPNADFEWGEVTDMVALNLEAVYRIPHTTRSGVWAPYVGAGPSLNFIHQSFQTTSGQSRDISFGNFDYETGFNILMGVQNRHGTFFELKTSLYSQPAPVLRLILGKTF
jgi:hypothetical protein